MDKCKRCNKFRLKLSDSWTVNDGSVVGGFNQYFSVKITHTLPYGWGDEKVCLTCQKQAVNRLATMIDNEIEKLNKSVMGLCPLCDSDVVSTERRPNGNDKCVNGHVYPSHMTKEKVFNE